MDEFVASRQAVVCVVIPSQLPRVQRQPGERDRFSAVNLHYYKRRILQRQQISAEYLSAMYCTTTYVGATFLSATDLSAMLLSAINFYYSTMYVWTLSHRL